MSHSDSPPDDSQQSAASAASLPPVQPPSASFILQLFIIPGMIVFVIIMVWLAFHWLAHMGSNPAEMIREMRQNKANSWQVAYNFSEELRQNKASREDPELARELANFLDALLDEPLPAATGSLTGGDPRSQEVIRRGFLCKALGEFTVPEVVLPVLIRAGSTNANDDELRVRLAALEAIALLLENTRHRQPPENKQQPPENKQQPPENKQLLPLLLASSENKDHKIATRAAVALAIVENDRATNRLVEMLEEPQHADVHYNVAMGLARLGHLASLEVLLEMLDPNEQRALVDEPSEEARNLKQTRIYLNALRASRLLAKQNQEADLAPLERGVKRLLAEQDNPQVRIEGNATLRELQNRNAP